MNRSAIVTTQLRPLAFKTLSQSTKVVAECLKMVALGCVSHSAEAAAAKTPPKRGRISVINRYRTQKTMIIMAWRIRKIHNTLRELAQKILGCCGQAGLCFLRRKFRRSSVFLDLLRLVHDLLLWQFSYGCVNLWASRNFVPKLTEQYQPTSHVWSLQCIWQNVEIVFKNYRTKIVWKKLTSASQVEWWMSWLWLHC